MSHGQGERTHAEQKLRLRRWLPALLFGVIVTGLMGIGGYRKLRGSAVQRGQCRLLVEPSGAHVWVNDGVQPIGRTRSRNELMTVELGVGSHRFALSTSQDRSKRSDAVTASVVEGGSCNVTLKDFQVGELPSPASSENAIDAGFSANRPVLLQCQVLVEPAGVQLWVDDAAEPIHLTQSRNEMLTIGLNSGQHRFFLRSPKGGASRSEEVTVNVTEREPCILSLKSLPSTVMQPVVGNGMPKTLGPRLTKSGATRFQITTKPRLHVIEIALGVCSGEHLAPLGFPDGTTIKLERSGTLAIADGPPAVFRSGFNLCVRQALARVSHDLIPESATIKTIREQ